MVGSARLVLSCGIKPENLAIAIAAAMYYYNETDEFAIKLKEMRENEGIDAILEKVCSLEPDGELGMLVKEKLELLKSWGYIK